MLFLAAALVSIGITGYYFGTFDQFAHVPFMKSYADPTLYPTDPFITAMRDQNYSYFWHFLALIYRVDLAFDNAQPYVLAVVMFALHLFATYFTFWMFWELSYELFNNYTTTFLSTVVFIIPHVGFGGFPVFEWSLLNRTFVLPFLLWAILLYLRKQYLWAFLLAGVVFNLHVISVMFLMAMLGLDMLGRWRTLGWRIPLASGALFLLGSAPVLLWRLSAKTETPFMDALWFDMIARGSIYHLFYMFAPYLHVLLITSFGLSCYALYFIARRQVSSNHHEPTIRRFMLAVTIVLGVQVVTSQFAPITLIIQLQIIRAGMFALIFGYLYFVHYLVTRREANEISPPDFGWLMGTLLGFPSPLLPVLVWGTQWKFSSARARQIIAVVLIAVHLIVVSPFLLSFHLWQPGFHPFGPQNGWYAAQMWAKHNTPKDTLFITPPEKWSLYDSDWRVFSERGTVVTLADLLMVALVPEYTATWKERFDQLAPGALDQFAGNFFDNQATTSAAYYSHSRDDYLRIGAQYHARYIVMARPHTLALPVAYENAEYVIYELEK
ncbi:MAG: hypothetical protein DWI57_17300 [Chloroflexi bacterium]|nr:MAG: hypothetical protein DWI57_17300 [Chloroflexota bacterium]